MHERFVFSDLRELFAKANEEKSGDQLAGIAARSEAERVAAKRQLADLSLLSIVQQPLIDPGCDEVSKLIMESFDRQTFQPIKSMTVGEFREYILDDATNDAQLKKIQRAIIPDVAAAVAKIMSNKDLVLAAATLRVAEIRWANAGYSAYGSSRTIPSMTSAGSYSRHSRGCSTAVVTR